MSDLNEFILFLIFLAMSGYFFMRIARRVIDWLIKKFIGDGE